MPLPATFIAEQPPEYHHALVAGQGLPHELVQLQASGGGLDAARRHTRLACTWVSQSSAPPEGPLSWAVLPAIEPCEPPPTWPLPGPLRDAHDLPREANTPPRVSVILRSMDRATLGEALESIAVQTYPNVEVMVVNALGAGHRQLLSHCGSFTLRLIASTDGSPLPRAQAANLGLENARGEWALFLDDDDLLLPDHLAKLVAALHAQPDAVAAFADVEMGHDEAGRWQTLHRFDAGFDPTRLLFENYLPIHGVLFRRPTDLRLDESFDLFEDWDFWLQLSHTGRFVHAPGVSARYRVDGLQQSNVFSDTPAAREARSKLIDKWRLRLSPELYHAALQQLQQLYRSNAQTQAELALARQGSAAQLAVLRAREHEIEAALAEQTATSQLVQAREQEIEAARLNQISIQQLVQARERELADSLAEIGSLREVLAARDEEVGNLQTYVVQLGQQLTTQAASLSDREQQLTALHAETPMLALKRTLRKKKHATTER